MEPFSFLKKERMCLFAQAGPVGWFVDLHYTEHLLMQINSSEDAEPEGGARDFTCDMTWVNCNSSTRAPFNCNLCC